MANPRADILAWLLEENDPSVRYRTLVDLLGYPLDDPQVRSARDAIVDSKPVKAIMKRMHPDGYWLCRGRGDGMAYALSSSTHFVLAFLAELGLDRSEPRIAGAVERYLSLEPPKHQNPFPWELPPDYRNHQSCLYAYNLRTFIILGYRDDPRIQTRVQVLLEDERSDGGYLCDRTAYTARTKSCIRGSTKALMAFAALPDLWSSPRCLQLIDYFIRRRLLYPTDAPGQIIREELTRADFPFLVGGSLLEPLYALSTMGYGQHPALDDAWEQLDRKRDGDGRYLLDWYPTGIYFNPGLKGKPNEWVTLYALMALQSREPS